MAVDPASGTPPDDAPLQDLIDRLQSPEPIVRLGALHAMGRRRLPARARDAVLDLVGDAVPEVACQACLFFAFHRPRKEARSALPRILEAFRSAPPAVRRAASVALVNLSYPPAVPALIDALSDPEIEVRRHALVALANLGPRALSALKAVEGVLDAKDEFTRCSAATYIENLRGLAAPLLPELEKAMAARPENRAIYRLARFSILRPRLYLFIAPFWYLGVMLGDALNLRRRSQRPSVQKG